MLALVLVSFVVSSVSVSGNYQLWAEQANINNNGRCPEFFCSIRCQAFPAATCVVEKNGHQCKAKYYIRHIDVTGQCNQNIQVTPMTMPSYSSRRLPEDKSMFSGNVIDWLSLIPRFMKRDLGDLGNPENLEKPSSTIRDIIENVFAEMVPTHHFNEQRFFEPNRNVPWNFAKPENIQTPASITSGPIKPFSLNDIPKAISTVLKTSSDWLPLLSTMIERDPVNNGQTEVSEEPISIPADILKTLFTKLFLKEPSQTPTPALSIPMAQFSWNDLPNAISTILKTSMDLLPLLSMNTEKNNEKETEDSEEPIPIFSDILNIIYGQLKNTESSLIPFVMQLIPKTISTIVETSNDRLPLFSRNTESDIRGDGPPEEPIDTIVDILKNIYQQRKESIKTPVPGRSIPMAPVSWGQLPNTVSILQKVMRLVPLLVNMQKESTEEEDTEEPISVLSVIEKELHGLGYKTQNNGVMVNSPTYNFYRAISVPTQSLKPQNVFGERNYRHNLPRHIPHRTRYATGFAQNIPEAPIFRASQYMHQPSSSLNQVILPYHTQIGSLKQFSPAEPISSSRDTRFIQQPFLVPRSMPRHFPITASFLQRRPFIARHTNQRFPESTQIINEQFFPTVSSQNLHETRFAQHFTIPPHDPIPQSIPAITQYRQQRFPGVRRCIKTLPVMQHSVEQHPRSLIIRRTQWYPTSSNSIQPRHSATRDSPLHLPRFPSNANFGKTLLQGLNRIQQLPTTFVHGRPTNTLEKQRFPVAQNPNIFGRSFPKLSMASHQILTVPKPVNLPSAPFQQISNPVRPMPWFNSNARLFQNKQAPAKNKINRSFAPQTAFPVVSPSGVQQTLSANENQLPFRTVIPSQRAFDNNVKLSNENQQHFPMPVMGLKISSSIQHIPPRPLKETYAPAPVKDLSMVSGVSESIPIQTVNQKPKSMTLPEDSQTRKPSTSMAKELIIIKSLKPRIPSKSKQENKDNNVGKSRPIHQRQVSIGEFQNLPSERISSKLNTNVIKITPEVHHTPNAPTLNSSSDQPKEAKALPLAETTKKENLPFGAHEQESKLNSEESSHKMTPNVFKMPLPKSSLPNILIMPPGNSEFKLKKHLPKPLPQNSKSSKIIPKMKTHSTQTSVKLQKSDASVQNIPKLPSSNSEFTLKKHLPKPLPQDSKSSKSIQEIKTHATQTSVKLQKSEASIQNIPKLPSSNSEFTLKKHLPKPLPQDSKSSKITPKKKTNVTQARVKLQMNAPNIPKLPSSDNKITLKSHEQKKHLPKSAPQDSSKTVPKKKGNSDKTPVKPKRKKTFGF